MGDEASKIALSPASSMHAKKRNIIDIDDIYQSIIEANQKVRGLNVEPVQRFAYRFSCQ